MGWEEAEGTFGGELKSESVFLETKLFSRKLNKVSSRESLWRRVVEMGKGSVDLVNALTGKDLPQAFKAAGLNETSV